MAADLDGERPAMSSTPGANSSLARTKLDLGKQLVTTSPFPSSIFQLEAGNYLIWKAQALPLLRGHKLDKFVLKDEPVFMEEISALDCEVDEEILEGFPLEQQLWILQDQLLQGWLVAAISRSVAGLVIGLRTSRRIWLTLEANFASKSRMNLIQMRIQLQNTKKGSMDVATYFLKMKGIADQMAAGGSFIAEDDLVSYVLGGLGQEYEMLVVNLTTRPVLPGLHEVKQHLLYYENRLESANSTALVDLTSNFSRSVHLANVHTVEPKISENTVSFNSEISEFGCNNVGVTKLSSTGGSHNGVTMSKENTETYNSQRGDNVTHRVKGKNKWKNGKLQCQICKKLGHTGDVCYFRSDTMRSL